VIGIILAIALAQEPTVAVIAPDGTAEIVLRSDAQAQFDKLCADATDDRRLKALATGLHPMPNWAQFVMNRDPSVCNRNPKPIVPVPIENLR
jgi:hypothetical protein